MTKSATALLSVLVLAAAGVCSAADDGVDAATLARIAQYDKGPTSVDVSRYPKVIQGDYRTFRQKCSVCHTPARPINSDFALPDEWSRYVKRMMHKPGSMIGAVDAKRIYTFLVHDASVRRESLLESKLALLAPADRAEQEAKIAAVRPDYRAP